LLPTTLPNRKGEEKKGSGKGGHVQTQEKCHVPKGEKNAPTKQGEARRKKKMRKKMRSLQRVGVGGVVVKQRGGNRRREPSAIHVEKEIGVGERGGPPRWGHGRHVEAQKRNVVP